MVNSMLVRLRELELSLLDSSENEPHPPPRPDQAVALGGVIQEQDGRR